MNNNQIDITKYRGNNSTSYTGRPEGKNARENAKLDDFDTDQNVYTVLIPKGTTAFNPSFFLGFFFDTIKKLGIEEFEEKYILTFQNENENELNKKRVLRDIEEGKRHAKNQLQPKTGFFKFLK